MSCSEMKGGFIPDEDLPEGGRRRTRKNRIGPLKEGKLTRFGYAVTKGKTARHRALNKAVRSYGPLSTFRKLQAVSTFTKRTSKGKSRTFKADRNWVRKRFFRLK